VHNSPSLLDVTIHEDMWLEVMTIEKWERLLEQCRDLVLEKQDRRSVSVCLINNEEMADLNGRYRSKPSSTNVLAFPQENPEILGDIALAYNTIQQEALEQGKTFMNHLTHLFIHGLLHLKGYDHETPEESNIMEDLEVKVLAVLGIENPYE